MSPPSPFVVIVVDDVCRFAVYVWRYLGRSIGFGTGRIATDGHDFDGFGTADECHSLPTPDGDAEVWWVNIADPQWEDRLNQAIEATAGSRARRFLVDVRGPYAGMLHDRDWSAGVDRVRDLIAASPAGTDPKTDVLLVSSYQIARQPPVGREPYPRIYPKAPETLQILWEAQQATRKKRLRQGQCTQILVTGAGFEFKSKSSGKFALGVRPTWEVLTASLVRAGERITETSGYPIPERYQQLDGDLESQVKQLNEAAIAKPPDLDTYWDKLLAVALAEASGPGGKPQGTVRPDKVLASEAEHRLRDTFREELLKDDWGFLDQAGQAIEIPGLECWLTTNYTRFADRAIDLAAARRPTGPEGRHPQAPAWRVVSTAAEASRLLQEILQTENQREGDDCPYLFKLHGDISHLLTMALAGHDKELYTPLSLPIASLHAVYTAAEQLLLQRLKNRPGLIVWHIVGHGLQDRLLVRLIERVARATGLTRHHFVVADVATANRPETKLWEKGIKDGVYGVKTTAGDYLARLCRAASPPRKRTGFSEWVESLGVRQS
jgi:hypothetical protein